MFLVGYDLAVGDARVPYSGVRFDPIPASLPIPDLLDWTGRIVEYVRESHPSFALLFVLWAVMAGVVSLGEWTGRWIVGLLVAVGGGVFGYALVISENPNARGQALISLGFAAIMYGVLRYLGSRVRG